MSGSRIQHTFLLLSGLLFFIRCSEPHSVNSIFIEKPPQESGIHFQNLIDPFDSINIINYLYAFNGGGVALGDINNDSLTDIFFTSNRQRNRLYLNKGNLIFEDISETSGISEEINWSTGVNMVDVNGDGLLDIYVCNLGNHPLFKGKNELYINRGNLTFVEEAAQYQLDIAALSTQSAFFDYDLDGDLDMYLLCHSVHSPGIYSDTSLRKQVELQSADRLLLNDGSQFVDVTQQSGIYRSKIGYGLGIAIADLNNDRWPDIYVGNDFHENDYLYLNNRDGSFTESSNASFNYTSKFSMGNDIADLNNNGLMDVFSLDMKPFSEQILKQSDPPESYQQQKLKRNFGYLDQYPRNALQLNIGNYGPHSIPKFSEQAQLFGMDATDWSWAVLVADYNLDGKQDVFVSNGILHRPNDMDYLSYISNTLIQNQESDSSLIAHMPDGASPNQLFLQNAPLEFSQASHELGTISPSYSQGAAYGDLDNDGDPDLVINNTNAPASILENTSSKNNGFNFIKIHLSSGSANRFAIGSMVSIHLGDEQMNRSLQPVRGFQSSVDYPLLFGLGTRTQIDSMIIHWMDGSRQTILQPAINQSIYLHQPEGNDLAASNAKEHQPLIRNISEEIALPFIHREDEYDDFLTDKLLLYQLSREGPAACMGDVNGDGLEDLFIGGAKGQEGKLYLQGQDGGFVEIWNTAPSFEEVDAEFADLDNDGDLDLFIARGGVDRSVGAQEYKNQLYFNDGQGYFTESFYFIDNVLGNSAAIAITDFDKDGWKDIFVAGRSMPGIYGLSPENVLYKNIQGKDFVRVLEERSENMSQNGMNTDAVWVDLDGNGFEDLVLAGHWSPIQIFWNSGESLDWSTIPNSEGWWNSIYVDDVDGDQDMDLLLGNLGSNHSIKDLPIRMYVNDFDNDRVLDPVFSYFKEGREHPIHHKDDLSKQMNEIKKKFTDYQSFSNKTIHEIFDPQKLKESFVRQVVTFQSSILYNEGDRQFRIEPLPNELQNAPIYSFAKLGNADAIYLAAGNFKNFVPMIGQQMSGFGWAFRFENEIQSIDAKKLGFFIEGEVKNILLYQGPDNEQRFLVIRNNDSQQIFEF